jgi:hypothetical protein
MPNLCNAATCAKLALDKVICDAVATAALNFYTQIVSFLRDTICLDLTMFFQVIALLAVICWIQNWLIEVVKFICHIPRVIKNLFCGKFNLCLLDCDGKSRKSESDSDADSDSNHY